MEHCKLQGKGCQKGLFRLLPPFLYLLPFLTLLSMWLFSRAMLLEKWFLLLKKEKKKEGVYKQNTWSQTSKCPLNSMFQLTTRKGKVKHLNLWNNFYSLRMSGGKIVYSIIFIWKQVNCFSFFLIILVICSLVFCLFCIYWVLNELQVALILKNTFQDFIPK